MKFFSESELEQYYGESFDDISPTDTPLDEYVAGQGSMECLECGDAVPVTCAGDSANGYIESAYCEACEIEFNRGRVPVVEDLQYEWHHHRTDEREEYVCSDCHGYHPITVVDEEWVYVSEPTFHSYETISLKCPCGKRIPADSLELPTEVSCEKCSRVFEFGVREGI